MPTSSIDYDAAIKSWLASKLGIGAGEIAHVDFDFEDIAGYDGCDTCGYGGEPGSTTIEIWARLKSGSSRYIEYDVNETTKMIREITEHVIAMKGGDK